ncbi:MAG: S-layer homology domain-containing protein [Leptolyngbyaceae cyanobacterium]
MVYPPPPPERRSSRDDPLGFDDFIALLVAVTGIGAVLVWAFSQTNSEFDLSFLQPTSTPAPIASPLSTASPSSSPLAAPTQLSPQRRLQSVEPLPSPSTPKASLPAPVDLPPPVAQPTPVSFADVPADYWANPFISELVSRNIMRGYPDGTFRPNQLVTRAEFSTLIGHAFYQAKHYSAPQSQGAPQHWAAEQIREADQMGFSTSATGDRVDPNQSISKSEALVALATGLKLQAPVNPDQILELYQDAAQIPIGAREKIAAATIAGLVVNYPDVDRLNPNQGMSRADAAALIYQALVQSGNANAIQSPYIARPNP